SAMDVCHIVHHSGSDIPRWRSLAGPEVQWPAATDLGSSLRICLGRLYAASDSGIVCLYRRVDSISHGCSRPEGLRAGPFLFLDVAYIWVRCVRARCGLREELEPPVRIGSVSGLDCGEWSALRRLPP